MKMKSLQRNNDLERRNRRDLFSSSEDPSSRGGGGGGSGTRSRRRDRKSTGSGNGNGSSSISTKQEAQEIQKSLMRTRGLLQNELQRVHTIDHAIEQDGTLLEQTLGDHKSLSTKQASKALKALKDAQRQERRVLNCSILFFLSVVLYVMW
eukprot:CAMPEP_0113479484 /NCGR_PEP_ID=MMETSP0014_2-20120614/21337_1 /TAXON_ID=2857 /ORGANISM="Nitzschia sp." /LENGTH=150 /DNA_ID=CAMNT_0000372791 /DNA_START=21 /DNA_END=470 /DNA_ORIENTATION=- /assembly_acc=CAM_ASM_000159